MEKSESYKILLDENWSLEDLYTFPKTFEQVYFFYESFTVEKSSYDRSKVDLAFMNFPWRGGYSAVNFYNKLKFVTPKDKRPVINSIYYASPGWIELMLVLIAAKKVTDVVKGIASNVDATHGTYQSIYRGMQERKLLGQSVKRGEMAVRKDELELERLEIEHSNFLVSSNAKMDKVLGTEKAEIVMPKNTNLIRDLKIKFSVFRRAEILGKFEQDGKIKLPDSED